jgi:hypothetical protein
MTSHSSTLGALDAFWDVLRRQAERDPAFAAELTKALGIPVEIKIETSADVQGALPFLDPFVVAGRGVDHFRQTFGQMEDADLKKIIKAFNLASKEAITGKGSPKRAALVTMMWEAASSQRRRWDERK